MFNQHPQAWFCPLAQASPKALGCLAADLGMSGHLPLASDGGCHVRMGGTSIHIPKPTKQGCYNMIGINSSMAQGHRLLGSKTGQGQPTSQYSPGRTGRKTARSPWERSLFIPEGDYPIVKLLSPHLNSDTAGTQRPLVIQEAASGRLQPQATARNTQKGAKLENPAFKTANG